MARGRRRLDPAVKLENVHDARQRHRATIANSNIATRQRHAHQVAEASENYRYRKRQEQRLEQQASKAARKQARGAETQALRNKHHPLAHMPSNPSTRKPPASVTLCPTPKPTVLTLWCDRLQRCAHCYDEDCIGCACICPDSDEWFEHADGHFFPTCDSCGRECPGCIARGTISRSAIKRDGAISSPPPTMMLLCQPIYAPDPGHEDRWNISGPFYAVISREWKGAVTSKHVSFFFCIGWPLTRRSESLTRILERYPFARTWKAEPWSTFQRLWNLDCTEYHHHEDEVPCKSLTLADVLCLHPPPHLPSTPPPPYLSITVTPTALDPAASIKGVITAPTPMTPKKLTREELNELANMRPRAGPISPRRLNQQFTRALGAQAVVSATPPFTPSPHSLHALAAPLPRPCTLPTPSSISVASLPLLDTPSSAAPHTQTPSQGHGLQVDREEEGAVEGHGALMYAVSGHNHLFRDRHRALATFQRSPGADLVFSHDEDEVFDFLAEEAWKMKI
ncbi:hypothetical protein DFH09DRAFT_1075434 [Mycena vulgaris]|nr:hypothetical protein DFH09DRAFT_1075434 [Mycena vulgaris]